MHSIFGLFPRSLTILRGIVIISPTLLSLHKRKEGRKEGVEREGGREQGMEGRKEGRKQGE